MDSKMPQATQTGVLDLIIQSGPMAKFVMLLLLGASVFSWAIIFMKWRAMKVAAQENALFNETFWHSRNVDDVFLQSDKYPRSPVASVFKAGYKELKRISGQESAPLESEAVENINRALMRASNSEVTAFEKHIGFLATTASAAPFVGLFGTVWGIMNSFQSIGATGAANLAVVAPGISEALITTATGIGAAIPAVIGYNAFAGQIKRLAADMDGFAHDFLNIIQRHAISERAREGKNGV
jgi:biopolymer transport protein TolQ